MTASTLMPDTLQWLPDDGQAPQQLMVLLHGWGASAQDMAPLAQALRRQFAQAAVLAPQGFEPVDHALAGRQWFSLQGVSDANRPERVAAVLPALAGWLRAAQAATGVGPAATALMGFSQGAILSLELVQRHDGLAGRVLAFSGRYAALPATAPQHTTLHFFHGADDPVIPAVHARQALQCLSNVGGDATIDIAEGVGHAIPASLMQCALQRLTGHIPHRTWAAAMGSVPGRVGPDGQLD
jgi:phospholipase/carboxylesterase